MNYMTMPYRIQSGFIFSIEHPGAKRDVRSRRVLLSVSFLFIALNLLSNAYAQDQTQLSGRTLQNNDTLYVESSPFSAYEVTKESLKDGLNLSIFDIIREGFPVLNYINEGVIPMGITLTV